MKRSRNIIAKNIANMLHDGDFVNLGVGIPTLVSNYIPKEKTILLHGENGYVGQDKQLDMKETYASKELYHKWIDEKGGESGNWREGHKDLCNAGGFFISLIPGAACFDSMISFGIARGGHLDATVLGGLQVDRHGNLANWLVPGGRINGMGGAMDLVSGAKKVIIAMEHTSKNGESKIVEECTMSLTALNCVDTIVTELCIINVKNEKLIVRAMAPGITKEELQSKTGAKLDFSSDISVMDTAE